MDRGRSLILKWVGYILLAVATIFTFEVVGINDQFGVDPLELIGTIFSLIFSIPWYVWIIMVLFFVGFALIGISEEKAAKR